MVSFIQINRGNVAMSMTCIKFATLIIAGALSVSSLAQDASSILTPLQAAPNVTQRDSTNSNVTGPSEITAAGDSTGLLVPLASTLERRALLESYLNMTDPQARYLKIESFAKENPWISLNDQPNATVHILTYLLQRDQEDDAVLLVKNRALRGWITYNFMDSVASDYMFALQGGHVKYLAALTATYPEGVNTPFTISLDGSQILPLSVLADKAFSDKPYYEGALRLMMNAGANPAQAMANGLTAITVASSAGNTKFMQILNRVRDESTGGEVPLLQNVRQNAVETAEMQSIMDALIEKSMEDRKLTYNYVKMHEFWIQMILKGYNTPANEILRTLETYPEFNIDSKTPKGLNAMMAAAMSRIYGGNVDYMKILVDKGADPHQLYELPPEASSDKPLRSNLIQMALYKDNYKVVAFLITKGVNFILTPESIERLGKSGNALTAADTVKHLNTAVPPNNRSDDGDLSADLIIAEALHLKAYNSALVIKEALAAYFEKMKNAK